MNDLDRLFQELEPAPGGWTRLSARLRRRHRSRCGLGLGLLLMAGAALWVVPQRPPPSAFDGTLGVMALSGRDLPEPVVSGAPGRVAVLRVSVDEEVVFYRVGGRHRAPY